MKHYNVVCAVIVNEGKVLCLRRPWRGAASTAGKWEFPGGKIEEGESPENALRRELFEEKDCEVEMVKLLTIVTHKYPEFSISLQAFLCRVETRDFIRKEHIDHCWLLKSELRTLDWAKADEKLIDHLLTFR